MTALLLVALLAATATCAPLQWTTLVPNSGTPPAARSLAGAAFDPVSRLLYVFGGVGDTGVLDDTHTFNVDSLDWSLKAPTNKPAARFSMISGFVTGVGFVIATGEGANGFFNDVWAYDSGDDDWTRLDAASGQHPAKRYGAAGGIFPGASKLFVSHGFAKRRFSDTWEFQFGTNEWSRVCSETTPYNPNRPHARCLMGSTMVADDDLVMFGGCATGGGTIGLCPNQEGWVRKAGKGEYCGWQRVEYDSGNPSPTQHAGVAYYGNHRAVMVGGESEVGKQILEVTPVPANEVTVINVKSLEFTRRKADNAGPRRSQMALVAGAEGEVFMFGGRDLSQGGRRNDVMKLTGSLAESDQRTGTNSWLALPMLHGLFMFLGWGVFLQAGAFIARYFRHRNPLWFKLHRICQVTGLLLAILGLILQFAGANAKFDTAHTAMGLVIMLVGIGQPINAYFRPHIEAGKPPTRRRKQWSFLHLWAGRTALFLALINILLGLLAIGAPTGAWAFYVTLMIVYALLYVVFEVRLRLFKAPAADSAPKKKSDAESYVKADVPANTVL